MKVRAFLLKFIARLQEIEISVYAGQTAFFLMLSFFPFLLFFFSLLQLTPLSEEDFFLWTMTIIPDSFQELLQEFSHEIFAGSSGKRISITILTAVFLSSRLACNVRNQRDEKYYLIVDFLHLLCHCLCRDSDSSAGTYGVWKYNE